MGVENDGGGKSLQPLNIWIKGSYEPKKDFDADLYWYVFNATCVENFTLTQLCVRMALEVAL